MVDCSVGGHTTQFLIDSGASIDTLAPLEWIKLKQLYERNEAAIFDVEKSSSRRIFAYATNKPLEITATFKAWIEVECANKPKQFTQFFVIKGAARSLLSKDTAKRLKLLNIGLSVNELSTPDAEISPPELGEKLNPFPKVPGDPIEFEIDESITPSRHNYFNVPEAFRGPARRRLEQMEQQDIIERVEGASEWVSGMSAVMKGDKDFRLVVNMRAPNKAIRRRFYHLPTMEKIKCKLAGAKRFTKLDLSNAFYHLELGERSRRLTTFMTENGTYRFKRLLFGVSCAPELFQERMEIILRGCEGVIVYIDDILIFGNTSEELAKRTEKVLAALKANNLTLNNSKCDYDKPSVKFLGHNVSQAGLNLDEVKVSTLEKFREPRTASELRSFLGLATYMSSFIHNFADMTEPLWKSARMHNRFIWGAEQREAFMKVKQAIRTCTVTQGFFSSEDEIELYTDASPVALGAVLTQRNEKGEQRVIAFASKSLSPVEKRYAQNQREALGIVWGVEKFFYYLLGRRFTIKTDAQGTAFIFDRTHQASRRILSRAEGWALRLNPYNYVIQHVNGSDNIADTPSRLFEGVCDKEYVGRQQPWEVCDTRAELLDIELGPEAMSIEDVKQESENDPEIRKLLESLDAPAWSHSDEILKKYAFAKHELYELDGVLMRTDRIVLPKSLQTKAIELAHKGHPGMSAMRRALRTRVWWPAMDREVEEYVKQCMMCVAMSRKDPPPPMKRQPLPKREWECLAIDFYGPLAKFNGVHVLVVVDYFTRYKWAKVMKSTDTDSTMKALDELFELHGYPSRLISDNGPPYFSKEFARACTRRRISFIRTVPYWPQHNGMVENAMKGVGKSITAALEEGKGISEALREHLVTYNLTPHSVTERPPEELLFKRRIRRYLPLMRHSLIPEVEAMRDRDWASKLKGKASADAARGAKEPRTEVGDEVIVINSDKSKLALKFALKRFTVVEKKGGDLILRDSDGKLWRRHITHTKKVQPGQSDDEQERVLHDPDDLETEPNHVQQEDLDTKRELTPELTTPTTSADGEVAAPAGGQASAPKKPKANFPDRMAPAQRQHQEPMRRSTRARMIPTKYNQMYIDLVCEHKQWKKYGTT